MAGFDIKEGELKDNSKVNLFSVVSHSLFAGSHTTTYKYCFFKSLLDNLFSCDDHYVLSLEAIGSTFASVYWNMINVYHIPQMPKVANKAEPYIQKLVNSLVAEHPYLNGIAFDAINDQDREKFLSLSYPKFAINVIGAFYGDTDGMIYGFSKAKKTLWLNEKSFSFLADNKNLLDQVNYYEWLKMCEAILDSNQKRIDNLSTVLECITKRADLSIFKDELNKLSATQSCFYCGKHLGKDAHLDHVIPWSFIKKDQLWNFVFACPSCNESKNDKMPAKEYLQRLVDRNQALGIQSPNVFDLARIANLNGVRGGWKPKK